jgi:hypothetical protein
MEGAGQRSVGEPNKQLQATPQSDAAGVAPVPDGRLGVRRQIAEICA